MSFSREVGHSIFWVAFNNFVPFGITFVTNIILARLLDPTDFGVVALAEVFLLLLNRIKEMGFDYAMIHRQDSFLEVASVNFSLQIILGLVVALVGALLSFYLTGVYGLAVGVSLLGLVIVAPIKGIISAYSTVLDKVLHFKQGALVTVFSFLVMMLSVVFLALKGFGYLSLTFGYIPGLLFNVLALWLISPVRLHFSLDRSILRWFLHFGPWWHWLLASFAALVIAQFDKFLVGTFLGTAILGYYSRSYGLATLISEKASNSFMRVLFPIFARFQDCPKELSQIMHLQLSLVFRLILPLATVVVANVEELVVFLIGPKWLPLVPTFRAMLLLVLFRPIFDALGYFFIAIGRPKVVNTVMMHQALLMLVLAPSALYFVGEVGLAVAVGVGMVFGSLVLYKKAARVLHLNIVTLSLNPIKSCVCAAALVGLLSFGLARMPLSSSSILLLRGGVFVVVYFSLMFLLEGCSLIGEFKRLAVLEKKVV